MTWSSLTSLFSNPRGHEAAYELAEAYRTLFNGTDMAKIVLADLANNSQFFQVAPFDIEPGELAAFNGKRAVFGRILRFLDMSEAEMEALRQAARQERIADEQGII